MNYIKRSSKSFYLKEKLAGFKVCAFSYWRQYESRRGDKMGKTSSKVKDRWNQNAYDNITLRVPKGEKDKIKAYAADHGKSVNGFITELIQKEMHKEKFE